MGVLVHMNLSSGLIGPVTSRIVQAALNAPAPSYPDSATAPEMLTGAPGVYQVLPGHLTNHRPVTTTGRVQITAKDGGLVLRYRHSAWRAGVRMLPAAPADPAFFSLDTGQTERPLVALVLDDDGRTKAIRFDRLVYMERNDSLEPWA